MDPPPIPSTSRARPSPPFASAFDQRAETPLKRSLRARGKAAQPQGAFGPSSAPPDSSTLNTSNAGSKQPRNSSGGRKGKARDEARNGGEDAPSRAVRRRSTSSKPPTTKQGPRERKRRTFKLAQPDALLSSADEDDAPHEEFVPASPPSTSAQPAADPSASNPKAQARARVDEDEWDWADPMQLPPPRLVSGVSSRRAEEWKALEYGGYRAALHDVAVAEIGDLGRVLVEWEGIRRWRARMEAEEHAAPAGEDAEEGEGGPVAPASSQPLSQPTPGQRPPFEVDSEREHSQTEETIPLPSALSLEQMARWPLHPSALLAPAPLPRKRVKPYELTRFPKGAEDEPPFIEEALGDVVRRVERRQRRAAPRERPRAKGGARSAYGGGGPFAGRGESLSEVEEELFDTGNLSASSLDSNPSNPQILPRMTHHLDALLLGMVQLVPKGPLPALDYWTRRARGAKGEPSKRKSAVGWEGVVGVVREMRGLPSAVARRLEERLRGVYGARAQGEHGPPPSEAAQAGIRPMETVSEVEGDAEVIVLDSDATDALVDAVEERRSPLATPPPTALDSPPPPRAPSPHAALSLHLLTPDSTQLASGTSNVVAASLAGDVRKAESAPLLRPNPSLSQAPTSKATKRKSEAGPGLLGVPIESNRTSKKARMSERAARPSAGTSVGGPAVGGGGRGRSGAQRKRTVGF